MEEKVMEISDRYLESIITRALQEDLGEVGDITTNAVLPEPIQGRGYLVSKGEGVLAGIKVAEKVFLTLDKNLNFQPFLEDGLRVIPGERLTLVQGSVQSILTAERTALNFLQRLSGIATLTAKFVEKVKPYAVRIVDTRKTTPGLRLLEKYAVRMGGGFNHRLGLYDAILIKDNHIKAVGGISQAIRNAQLKYPDAQIEIEIQNREQLEEVLNVGADIIMFDNLTLPEIKETVSLVNHRAVIEVSGGVTLDNVAEIAKTGVDLISVGALTHSAPALDMSLEIEAPTPSLPH